MTAKLREWPFTETTKKDRRIGRSFVLCVVHPAWHRASGALLPRVPGILKPGHRNKEERRQEHAQQHVDPDERQIEGAHSEAGNEGSQRPAKALFHVSVRVEKVDKAPRASYSCIS